MYFTVRIFMFWPQTSNILMFNKQYTYNHVKEKFTQSILITPTLLFEYRATQIRMLHDQKVTRNHKVTNKLI